MNIAAEPLLQIIQPDERYVALLNAQRAFFATGATRSVDFRIAQIKKLRDAIRKYDKQLCEALQADLRKSEFEAYASEIGFVLEEIGHALKHIKSWSKPKTMFGPLTQFLSFGTVVPQPYGQVLVIAPWNYPVQLTLNPLLGALTAGNTVILKPSEITTHTSQVLAKMIGETFPPEQVAVVEGGIETNQQLLNLPVDYIFFTGSPKVGKIVAQAAAKHMIPYTLELGGKSPVFIDSDCHLEFTARRLVWGKFFNNGQTCIAPDYLLVNKSIKDKLVERMKYYLVQFYGSDPKQSPDLSRVVNDHHYRRLVSYLQDGNILVGGQTDESCKYIAPTLLDNVDPNSSVMTDEIFGPILPILTYEKVEEAIEFVNRRPKPLALYVFTNNKKYEHLVLSNTTSGGGCVNDVLIHLTHPDMPFGGVGNSGVGRYHGKYSFEAFSHYRSILKRSNLLDPMLRYSPYKDRIKLIRKLVPSAF